jgi:hypothetical protein
MYKYVERLGWEGEGTRQTYEGHLESKERFAIKKYLLIIGKKKNMQVLSHTFTYFSTYFPQGVETGDDGAELENIKLSL